MRAPRYGSRSLVELLPSVASALRGGGDNPLGLPAASQVVLVVVDGLGQQQLLQVAERLPTLGAAVQDCECIDAAFPTTTPVGVASIAMAMPPARHGLVGASFELPDFERVLNPLHWENDPPALAVQPEPNFFSGLSDIVVRSHGPASYATSGMTRTLLGSALQCGYERFDASVIEAASGRLDYVYLPELDKVGHGEGPLTGGWIQTLQHIDALVQRILRRLPESALVVLSSDHGMVRVPDDRRLDADHALLQAGVRLMAGEPRMRQLYCSEPDVVRERWQAQLGERATVLLRHEALDRGLFGEPDIMLIDRIGDVIVIANENWAFTSKSVDPKPSGLRGMHGALTDDELLVPLLVMPGVA